MYIFHVYSAIHGVVYDKEKVRAEKDWQGYKQLQSTTEYSLLRILQTREIGGEGWVGLTRLTILGGVRLPLAQVHRNIEQKSCIRGDDKHGDDDDEDGDDDNDDDDDDGEDDDGDNDDDGFVLMKTNF